LLDTELQRLLEPVVVGLGYELVGVERLSTRGSCLVRVYIDQEAGIGIEDCEQVSRQVSAVMDVEDPVRSQYTLEVSSPGLERPLFKAEHYRRFIGANVRIQLRQVHNNRRRFCGVLQGVENDEVQLQEQDVVYYLPLSQIEKAHLIA